jgi:hypothetical protein
MYYNLNIHFEMFDLITNKHPAQQKKYDSINLKCNEQEMAVNILLCVTAYNKNLKPGTHYPHVTYAHIKLAFYFQLLPYPFPCVGSHMLISIIW